MENKVYSMLGMAAKAGKLFSGDQTCESYIKASKAQLVVVATNASDNTKKKFSDMCKYRGITIKYFGETHLLGKYIGKDVRAVVVILDKNFASIVEKLIDVASEHNGGEVIGEG